MFEDIILYITVKSSHKNVQFNRLIFFLFNQVDILFSTYYKPLKIKSCFFTLIYIKFNYFDKKNSTE